MAVKTKAVLEAEVKKLTAERDALKAKLDSIPETINECVDEYGLDLCQDGLEDFCQRIGVVYKQPRGEFRLNIYLGRFEAPSGDDKWSMDDGTYSDLVTKLEKAIYDVFEAHADVDSPRAHDIDFEIDVY